MPPQVRTGLRSDARDNRQRILTEARAAFASDGIDVPLRAIARRAGVGVATLYRHFPSKDALVEEAFAAEMVRCSAVIADGLDDADPWTGFTTVLERLMTMHALDRGLARAFTSHLEAQELSAERHRSLQLLARLLQRAQAAGAVRPDVQLTDVTLALMANEGIRATSPERRVQASRRLAALINQSFDAGARQPGTADLLWPEPAPSAP
jgi:AcrR family transcriptional regulator